MKSSIEDGPLITRRQASQLLLAPVACAFTAEPPPKILIVVAHPDDEYYFAATVYRLAQELGATVDQVVITNGEGGYRYSSLAEKIYGVALTDEATGRSRLPAIRRQETLNSGRILGIRQHHFLNQRDLRFTLDSDEALSDIWNCTAVRDTLRDLLRRESYQFIFTMLPRESTHGHHQAATLLALDVAASLPAAQRPVVLAAEPGTHSAPPTFDGLPNFARAQTTTAQPEFAFSRRQALGPQGALSYDIIVNWVIAEHKSQGLFQTDSGKHDTEFFWRFTTGPDSAAQRTEALAALCRLNRQPARH